MGNLVYQEFGTGGPEASRLVNKMVRKGLLDSPRKFSCVDCGRQACDYDHRDYNKPLEVFPVCRPCNAKRGAAIPKTMTFQELMANVRASGRFESYCGEVFERLRRRYWPNEQQGDKQ